MSEIYSNGVQPVSSSDFWQDFSQLEYEVLKLLRDVMYDIFLVMDCLETTFLLSCTVWHDSLIVIWDVLGNNGHSSSVSSAI